MYLGLLLLLLISFCIYLTAWIIGDAIAIGWDVQNVVKPVQILFDYVQIGLYDFPLKAENYVLLQNFIAKPLQYEPLAAYFFLGFFWFGILAILSIIPDLSRFWFLFTAILFIIILVVFRLENLMLFEIHGKAALIITLTVFLAPAYYFHAFGKYHSLLFRFIAYVFISAGLFVFFKYTSGVDRPFIYLVNYAIYAPIIISVFFILLSAHEIMAGFLHIITSGNTFQSSKSLLHFLVIGSIYLANIALVFLYNRQIIDWNISIVSAFWILPLSVALGIWGFKHRESAYINIFPFMPTGAILYIALAIICFSTVSYAFVTSNDALLSVMEDAVIYSQLAYGIIFIVYVLTNFFPLLMQNMMVYKVVYQPKNMPFFTSRLASALFVLALVLASNKRPYYQSMAAYYNGLADLFYVQKDPVMAEEYYQMAAIYDSNGHRPNYALASMARSTGNISAELSFLGNAVQKRPTPYAFANLARGYSDRENFFDGLFALRLGIEKFPENGRLISNLGTLFTETNFNDSAYAYLTNAQNYSKSRDVASSNIYALLSLKDLSIRRDTLAHLFQTSTYTPALSNLMVLSSGLGLTNSDNSAVKLEPEADKLVYAYNRLLNKPALADSSFWNHYNSYYDAQNSQWFRDQLGFAGSLASIQTGNLAQGMMLLEQKYIQEPDNRAYLGQLLGWLMLKSGAPRQAAEYFISSATLGTVAALPGLGLALAEAHMRDSACHVWEKVLALPDTSYHSLATEIIVVCDENKVESIMALNDRMKYNFLRYRINEIGHDLFEAIALSISRDELVLMAQLDRIEYLLNGGNTSIAQSLISKVGESDLLNGTLLNRYIAAGIWINILNDNHEAFETIIQSLDKDTQGLEQWVDLSKLLLKAQNSDDSTIYSRAIAIGYKNPFFEEGVIQSAMIVHEKDPEKAYDILMQAIRLNRYSERLYLAYIRQCAIMGLNSFAREALETLSAFASKETYQNARQMFDEMYESSSNDW